MVNLFTPTEPTKDFLSAVGYGALMGLLKNYEVVNPFITATNDSLNRLKPGFEAPVCIVTSLGHTPEMPSRNRSILVGLVRDITNPMATRFELRSPNPYTNTYIAIAASYLAMLDGIRFAVESGKSTAELEAELSKPAGTPGSYLETERAYRSEHDIFDDYTPEERDRLFGHHPATVWENMQNLVKYPEKVAVLTASGALRQELIDAFVAGALKRWQTELISRIIPENLNTVKQCVCLHDSETATDLDLFHWEKIVALKMYLAKDTIAHKSLFTRLKEALTSGEYSLASELQKEMTAKMSELEAIYAQYKRNMIHFC